MNRTATYLKDLLYRYDCVILPGFGAFLTKRKPAYLSKDSHSFYPPSKEISFNEQLQHNDGLLANYIASVENCSYAEAVNTLERYVAKLKSSFQKEDDVYINAIGFFHVSTENNLQFKPDFGINYLPEAFGLSEISTPAVILENTERVAYKKQVAELEEKAPIAFTPEKRTQKSYGKHAATAALIIGVTGLLSYAGIQIRNEQVKDANFATRTEVVQTMNSLIQEATFEINNPLPAIHLAAKSLVNSPPAKANNHFRYHLVAGAFRIKQNAVRRRNALQESGYNARLIGKNSYGLHQVVYDSYVSRAEALQALKTIKSSESSRAWLLISSPDQ